MSEIDTSKKPQRYYVPSGGGVAPNPCGLIYLREEADAMINALAAERDAAVARVAELEAEVERAATERGTYHAEGYATGWKAAIEAAAKKADDYGCEDILRPAEGWTEPQVDWWIIGGQDHCIAVEEAIRTITMPADTQAALDRLTAKARAQGMREAAEIAANRYAVCEDAFSKGLGAEERHCALEAKHIEDKILARAEEIEKAVRNG